MNMAKTLPRWAKVEGVPDEAMAFLISRFRLDPRSPIHGVPHWRRVAEAGTDLALATPGARVAVAKWFAVVHDSARENDDADPQHGHRAVRRIAELSSRGLLPLDALQAQELAAAVAWHSFGLRIALSPSVGVCWDADRLDLPRVGIMPDAARMCTAEGRRIAEAKCAC